MRMFVTAMMLAILATPAIAAPGDEAAEGQRERGRNPERRQQMIDRFDTDGDGKLNEEERQAAREARQARGRERGDRQGRGRLGDPAAMFKSADTDGNGQLSQEEFTGFLQQMRAARGGQRDERGPRARGGDRGPREGGARRSRGREDRNRPPVEVEAEIE